MNKDDLVLGETYTYKGTDVKLVSILRIGPKVLAVISSGDLKWQPVPPSQLNPKGE